MILTLFYQLFVRYVRDLQKKQHEPWLSHFLISLMLSICFHQVLIVPLQYHQMYIDFPLFLKVPSQIEGLKQLSCK